MCTITIQLVYDIVHATEFEWFRFMTERRGRVLVVDDDPDVLVAARLLLKKQFAVVQAETDPGRLPELLEAGRWDVILLDMNFSPGTNTGREGMQ